MRSQLQSLNPQWKGRYVDPSSNVETGSRFDDSMGKSQAVNYRKRYWNDHNFRALGIIADAAAKENLTVAEVALRWMSHHSLLKRLAFWSIARTCMNLVDTGNSTMQ